MPAKKFLLITLNIFSSTGGIEKVSKIAGKALYEIAQENGNNFKVVSLYDTPELIETRYFPSSCYIGFKKNKLKFFLQSIFKGYQSNIVFLTHINLLSIGFLIKLFSPGTKVFLFAHGIEIWQPIGIIKLHLLRKIDTVLCVSRFTKEKISSIHRLPEKKLFVLNNCLDPFLPKPEKIASRSVSIRSKLGINKNDIVLLTLSRLSKHDRDKGFTKVLQAMKKLSVSFPNLKYVIAGKYEVDEKEYLENYSKKLNLEGSAVVFSGFVSEEDLPAFFQASDIYVMPSTKEGFGIIFIEAMYYGLPVIGGNADGTTDALAQGKLGILVNPHSQDEIEDALERVLKEYKKNIPDINEVKAFFSFEVYKKNLEAFIQKSSLVLN